MDVKDFKKLEKIMAKDNGREFLNRIYEADNYYIASDSYRASILFKDKNNHTIKKDNDDAMANIAKIVMDAVEDNEILLEVNRKDFSKKLKELWTESQKIIKKRRLGRIIKLNIDYDNSIIKLSSDGIYKEINFTDKYNICSYHKASMNVIYFNYQYLTDFINYFDNDFITLQFKNKKNSLVCKDENKVSFVLPFLVKEE